MAKRVFVSFILKLLIKGQFGHSVSQDTSDLASHTTHTTWWSVPGEQERRRMGDRKAGTGGKKREGENRMEKEEERRRQREGGQEEMEGREERKEKLYSMQWKQLTTDGKMEVVFNICLMSLEGTYPEFLPKTDDHPEIGPQRTPLDQELLPTTRSTRDVCDKVLSY